MHRHANPHANPHNRPDNEQSNQHLHNELVPPIELRPPRPRGSTPRVALARVFLLPRGGFILHEGLFGGPHGAFFAVLDGDFACERVVVVVVGTIVVCGGGEGGEGVVCVVRGVVVVGFEVFFVGVDVVFACLAAVDALEGGGRMLVEGGVDGDVGLVVVLGVYVFVGDGWGEDRGVHLAAWEEGVVLVGAGAWLDRGAKGGTLVHGCHCGGGRVVQVWRVEVNGGQSGQMLIDCSEDWSVQSRGCPFNGRCRSLWLDGRTWGLTWRCGSGVVVFDVKHR